MADTPSEATAAAACYACIPNDMRMPVLIYLYNKLSGMNSTPQELVTAAACFRCIPHGGGRRHWWGIQRRRKP